MRLFAALFILFAAAPALAQEAAGPEEEVVTLSPDEQALADWEAFKTAQDLAQNGPPAPTPAFLDPMSERALLRRWTTLEPIDQTVAEQIAEEIFDTLLTDAQRAAMAEAARGFYASLSPGDRAALTTQRRAFYRDLTQGERAYWRREENLVYLDLTEAQKDIFRSEAIARFDLMDPSERDLRRESATILLQARRAEKQMYEQTQAGMPAPSSFVAVAGEDAFLTPEEQLRFEAMTPDQQEQYMQQNLRLN